MIEFFKEIKLPKLKKTDWIALALTGAILLIIALPQKKENEVTKAEEIVREEVAPSGSNSQQESYVSYLENGLEEVLGQMEGVGMMVRAEVVLVCAQKGVDYNMIDPAIMPFILILIIVSSLLAPLILKMFYRKDKLPPQFLDGGESILGTEGAAGENADKALNSPIKVVNSENQLDVSYHREEQNENNIESSEKE